MRMRLGTTSYIYPADLLNNARKLADKVDDIELVIFESPTHGENYPDKHEVAELREIARVHDLTYTIHLPLDLKLADDDKCLETALKVINCTQDLDPYGFIIHLDGIAAPGSPAMDRWLENSVKSLERMAAAADGPTRLCVENLDDQSPAMMDALLPLVPVSCCVDVGHLWKQATDPVPCLDAWLSRTRVIHLHGVGTRDHKGLSLTGQERLDPVVSMLAERFKGVLTFEVFNEKDFLDCQTTFAQALTRVQSIPPVMP
jgi:sugar phosphate isomerase/epimerase